MGITGTSWTFSDGSPASSETTVTRAFNAPVTVTLTVTDANGTDSTSQMLNIVPAPPVAAFDFSPAPPARPLMGQPVKFTARPPGGSAPVTYSWTFGDGGTASGATADHAFATAGAYSVTLTVRDALGRTNQTSQTVNINGPPTAAFDIFPAEPLVGQEVILSSYSSDPDGFSAFDWDLDGNGTFGDQKGSRIVGTFTTPGQRVVSLRVTDNYGATATASKTINVKASSWLAPITSDGGVKNASPPAAITKNPFLKLLAPFPVVRMAGWRTTTGASIEILGVRAPAGSRVLVKCRGKKCPVKRVTAAIAKKKPKPVRVKRFQRFFPAGSVIEVFVRRSERLGKYTRFTIRAERKQWKRMDGCVPPNSTRAVTCPAD
jgi:PKD repeat protein